jgi:hypothetical protein
MFKSLLLAAFVAVSFSQAQASEEEIVARAVSAYEAREYNAAGVRKAQEAADLYGQLVSLPNLDAMSKAKYAVRRSEAIYFIGQNAAKKADKVTIHELGFNVAKAALSAFGNPKLEDFDPKQVAALKATLSTTEQAILADAVYHYGIHLGQWGQANGVMDSLSKWPELRDSMRFVIELGQGNIYNFGPYRAIARGYHKIPSMFGGDKAKAEKYLRSAIDQTRAPGKIYSVSGYNNIFMAELLIDLDREEEAKALLSAFVTADPKDLPPAVDAAHAIDEAKTILAEM